MKDFNNIVSNYFTFFDTENNIINNVKSMNLSDSGAIESITYNDNDNEITLNYGEFTYTNLVLAIPGIGYAYCGDIIYLEQFRKEPTQLELAFGWHENVSNQKIFSWYLKPTPKSNINYIKTLYYDDLTNIIGVTHKSRSSGTVILDDRYEKPIFVNEFISIIGSLYKDFSIDDDGSVTFTDLDDKTHTIKPTYENGKIVSIFYDDYPIKFAYDSDGNLINIGGTTFNISKYNGGK